MKAKNMKKRTRKQITEAIAYWQKQLKLGNYKKTDESKNVNERTIEGTNRIEKPMKSIMNDNGQNVTVAELCDIADALYDGQDNALLNVGRHGEIFGQVNQVLNDNGKCVLTLAPYRNGSRSKNLSVDGCFDAPLKISKIMQLLNSIPSNAEVFVKMKDPYSFGPSANVPIKQQIKTIDVDSVYGVFLRVDDNDY